ncbi:MAG: SulP family inorganic anion transporter [Cyclobacteriaceae bacterium]
MNKDFLKDLKYDLPAGMVVFFVALPLCLGIALASGAPIFSGLIAGIIGGIVVGSLSGSKVGVSGPAAGLTAVVLTSIESLGTFELFLSAVVIAGIFQIIFSMLKAGVIAYYFPSSVIKGMLTGIGVIIILKQIPHALGYDADLEGDLSFIQPDGHNTFSELVYMLDYFTPGAILLSVTSLALLVLWEQVLAKTHKIFTLIQGPIVVVFLGYFYQIFTAKYFPSLTLSPEHLVQVPVAESVDSFVGSLQFPNFSGLINSEVWLTAITIAVVASLETLLCVEATDKIDPHKRITPTNRELFAQGVGNTISGLIGGLPITQVIIRSSANIQSGVRSKMSTVIHGFLLLISVLTIPNILNLIPFASLAAILLIVGYKLAKPSLFIQIYKLDKGRFIAFVVTVLGVVLTDLLTGIGLGLVVAVILILKNSYSNSHFMHIKKVEDGRNTMNMTLAEEVTFLNKGAILKELNSVPEGTHLTIDATESYAIDYDIVEVLENFKNHAEERDISVVLKTREDLETADY